MKIAKNLCLMSRFCPLTSEIIGSDLYTLTYNINILTNRLLHRGAHILYSTLKSKNKLDFIYQYGTPLNPDAFFKSVKNLPIFLTTGFMTDTYIIKEQKTLPNRQLEADKIAKLLEKAKILHFHTKGGMERFLSYRPECRPYCVNIPFFLPNTVKFENSVEKKPDDSCNILFVGADGKRKNLPKLIDALDILGKDYLDKNNVGVDFVTLDEIITKTNFKYNHYKKVTNDEVVKMMKKAHIFVMTSDKESYGLVHVEAMMAGCAIIADDEETRREILMDSAIFIKEINAENIAQALMTLIEDKEKRDLLASKSLINAEYYRPKRIANLYYEQFQKIVG